MKLSEKRRVLLGSITVKVGTVAGRRLAALLSRDLHSKAQLPALATIGACTGNQAAFGFSSDRKAGGSCGSSEECPKRVRLEGQDFRRAGQDRGLGGLRLTLRLALPVVPTLVALLALDVLLSSPKDRETTTIQHSVRGRVIPIGGQPLRAAKVEFSTIDGTKLGERELAYEGTFAFEDVLPGKYLLTLERENEATIGRPVEVKSYPTPTLVFLEITLNRDSASVREIVTQASNPNYGVSKEPSSAVSRKALRAFEQAAKESARGAPEKAIVLLQKAILEQPDYFEAHNNLGVQYQKLRRWEQAAQSYRRAIELNPRLAKTHVNLASVFLELGQIQSGLESLEAARQAEPGLASTHRFLGELYFRKQDYVKAQESLETATRLGPQESSRAFALLAEIALRHDDEERARQYLDLMKQYFPSDPETLRVEAAIHGATKP